MKPVNHSSISVLVVAGLLCMSSSQIFAQGRFATEPVSADVTVTDGLRETTVADAEQTLLMENEGECTWTSEPEPGHSPVSRTSVAGWLPGSVLAMGASLVALNSGSNLSVVGTAAFRSPNPVNTTFTVVPQTGSPTSYHAPSTFGRTRGPGAVATPEPGTWAMLFGGSATMLLQLRRRNRKAR
jgi:hypothetical protein